MMADEEEPEAALIFFWLCCDRDLQAEKRLVSLPAKP